MPSKSRRRRGAGRGRPLRAAKSIRGAFGPSSPALFYLLASPFRNAVRDHGIIKPDTIEQNVGGARHVLAAVEEHGIRLDVIVDKRVANGVKLFSDAFDRLLAAIEAQRRNLAG